MGECGWCHEKIAESVLVTGLCTICISKGCRRVNIRVKGPNGEWTDLVYYNPQRCEQLTDLYISAEAMEDLKKWGHQL